MFIKRGWSKRKRKKRYPHKKYNASNWRVTKESTKDPKHRRLSKLVTRYRPSIFLGFSRLYSVWLPHSAQTPWGPRSSSSSLWSHFCHLVPRLVTNFFGLETTPPHPPPVLSSPQWRPTVLTTSVPGRRRESGERGTGTG